MSEPSRVAPTAKIPDDAPFPPHLGGSPMPISKAPVSVAPNGPTTLSPPTYSPASIPPQNNGTGPASIPPQNNYISGPASIPPPSRSPGSIPPTNNPYPPTDLGFGKPVPPRRMAEPSMSMPAVQQPRWGLIIVILVLDLALAAAGAVMLAKGLAKPDAAAPSSTPAPTTKAADTAKPVEAPTAQANVEKKDVAASIIAAANGSNTGSAAQADANTTPKKDPPKQTVATKGKASPQDPYADPPSNKSVAGEIELAMVRSKADLAYCQEDAGGVHGRIDIQFTVLPTGAVDDLKILGNTTGNQALATCLVGVMTKWAFATKPTAPTNFVRPFIY
ncbi:MAG: hypothetical protein QM831_10695 [Kofleriaceae bacterium]